MRFIIPLAMMMLLTSCAHGSAEPESLPDSYKMSIKYTDRGREYKADMEKSNDGWEICYTAPETIKGLKINSSAEGYSAELEKLKFTGQSGEIPKSSPPLLIAKAFDMCAADKGIDAAKDGDKVINKGVVEGADFEVTFEDSEPVKIEIGGEIAGVVDKFS